MDFINKANELKCELKKRSVIPEGTVEFVADGSAFQKIRVDKKDGFSGKVSLLSGDKIILDFGEHCVGYLSLFVKCPDSISDSPVKLGFSFGEFPLEIVKDGYEGLLGSGWLQREEKTAVSTPASLTLDRRYSFRYLQIERLDSAAFCIELSDIVAECVSAVELESVKIPDLDASLEQIYRSSLKTLRDCEQDVFEDGPKRDRRLWIGDLRLQALADYETFKNISLVKRCIYLFAGYQNSKGEVVPCVYPNSPPHRLEWTFTDYSLFFISCMFDYKQATGDSSLPDEVYGIALRQAQIVSERLENRLEETACNTFIDWCPDLDKTVALLGVYIYTLRQLLSFGRFTDWIEDEIEKAEILLLSHYSEKDGLFLTLSGQVSYHSQIWAVLSGVLPKNKAASLLENMKKHNTEFKPRTPYMMHYYIEALVFAGLEREALEVIRNFWGRIVNAGFDTCPEIFNPENEFESPYNAPEINSACHAWSCTPVYWINKGRKDGWIQ